jgi:hypothetical protein
MQAPASEARRTYLSLLHGTAKSPLRARLEAILEEHGMGALEIIYNDGKAEGVALGKAEGVALGKAEGVALGEALALLTVLRRRRVSLSAEAEARIRSTTDVVLLERWLERAVEARDEADLFVGD